MTQHVIAFCGPDRCGKSEIARALSKRFGIPYFKASSEHETYLHDQERFLQQLVYADTRMVDFLRQTGYSVVFDRAWPCEFAYSLVFQRETSLDALSYVDYEMSKMGARIVVCRRKSYAGIVDDIDPTTKQERLEKLDAAYVDFAEWTKCKVLHLFVDDECLARELDDIAEWMGVDKLDRLTALSQSEDFYVPSPPGNSLPTDPTQDEADKE
jgi:hypothetical protein